MCAIRQLVSAPLNPIPIAKHFRRSHPQCEHSYGQHIYIYIYIYIDKLGRSLEPTAHLSPQRGSLMDSQSKPRRNVMNYREFRGDQGRTTL